jgi:hypothetical protein
MNCPYCGIKFNIDGVNAYHTGINFHRPLFDPPPSNPQDKDFTITAHKCPECRKQVIWLNELSGSAVDDHKIIQTTLLYPKHVQKVLPDGVPRTFADAYLEAQQTLEVSPRASAALSRRTLQQLIREEEGIVDRNLYREIGQLLEKNTLPTFLAQDVDAIRHVGNFGAHPETDQNSGEIIEVEPDEAEWVLSVLKALLEFYFVDRARSAARRAALNEKLRGAGKNAMLEP